MASWEKFYDGSRSFQFVAEATKMPIDQINFLLGSVGGVLVSLVFRRLLPAVPLCRQTASARNTFALTAGLALTYFCFGRQVLHAISLAGICYGLLLVTPVASVHHITLVVCMTLMSAAHLYRQLTQQAAFVIDVTGPMMMMVQRATCVAYGVHDGMAREEKHLTKMQQRNALPKIPSAVEYLSYLMSFQSILAGPFLMYRDYQDYIEGADPYTKAVLTGQSVSPGWATGRKLGLAVMFAVSTCLLAPYCTVAGVTGPGFSSHYFPTKLLLIIVSTTLARHLYYTAWLLAEAVCNMGGLGYVGRDDSGREIWTGASNVDIMGVEFGTSLRTVLDSWNSKTMIWLRYAAYERLPQSKKVAGTYLLSAIWHGFYPGYYCCFSTATLITTANRITRRSVRPRVLAAAGGENELLMKAYHVLTWMVTRLQLSYCTYSFVLLRFWPTVTVYWELYFYLQLLSAATVVALPILLPPPKTSKNLAADTSSATPLAPLAPVEGIATKVKTS